MSDTEDSKKKKEGGDAVPQSTSSTLTLQPVKIKVVDEANEFVPFGVHASGNADSPSSSASSPSPKPKTTLMADYENFQKTKQEELESEGKARSLETGVFAFLFSSGAIKNHVENILDAALKRINEATSDAAIKSTKEGIKYPMMTPQEKQSLLNEVQFLLRQWIKLDFSEATKEGIGLTDLKTQSNKRLNKIIALLYPDEVGERTNGFYHALSLSAPEFPVGMQLSQKESEPLALPPVQVLRNQYFETKEGMLAFLLSGEAIKNLDSERREELKYICLGMLSIKGMSVDAILDAAIKHISDSPNMKPEEKQKLLEDVQFLLVQWIELDFSPATKKRINLTNLMRQSNTELNKKVSDLIGKIYPDDLEKKTKSFYSSLLSTVPESGDEIPPPPPIEEAIEMENVFEKIIDVESDSEILASTHIQALSNQLFNDFAEAYSNVKQEDFILPETPGSKAPPSALQKFDELGHTVLADVNKNILASKDIDVAKKRILFYIKLMDTCFDSGNLVAAQKILGGFHNNQIVEALFSEIVESYEDKDKIKNIRDILSPGSQKFVNLAKHLKDLSDKGNLYIAPFTIEGEFIDYTNQHVSDKLRRAQNVGKVVGSIPHRTALVSKEKKSVDVRYSLEPGSLKLETDIKLYNPKPSCQTIFKKLKEQKKIPFKAFLMIYGSDKNGPDKKWHSFGSEKYTVLLNFIKEQLAKDFKEIKGNTKRKTARKAEREAAVELLQAIKSHAKANHPEIAIEADQMLSKIEHSNKSRFDFSSRRKKEKKPVKIIRLTKPRVANSSDDSIPPPPVEPPPPLEPDNEMPPPPLGKANEGQLPPSLFYHTLKDFIDGAQWKRILYSSKTMTKDKFLSDYKKDLLSFEVSDSTKKQYYIPIEIIIDEEKQIKETINVLVMFPDPKFSSNKDSPRGGVVFHIPTEIYNEKITEQRLKKVTEGIFNFMGVQKEDKLERLIDSGVNNKPLEKDKIVNGLINQREKLAKKPPLAPKEKTAYNFRTKEDLLAFLLSEGIKSKDEADLKKMNKSDRKFYDERMDEVKLVCAGLLGIEGMTVDVVLVAAKAAIKRVSESNMEPTQKFAQKQKILASTDFLLSEWTELGLSKTAKDNIDITGFVDQSNEQYNELLKDPAYPRPSVENPDVFEPPPPPLPLLEEIAPSLAPITMADVFSEIDAASDTDVLTSVHVKGLSAHLFNRFSEVYSKITPDEFYAKAWEKALTKQVTSPNLIKFNAFFNQLSNSVKENILSGKNEKAVKNRILFYVRLMENCFESGNLYGAQAILSALQNSSIESSFSKIKESYKNKSEVEEIEAIFSPKGNSQALRGYLEEHATIPLIVSTSIAQKDLVNNTTENLFRHASVTGKSLGSFFKQVKLVSQTRKPTQVKYQETALFKDLGSEIEIMFDLSLNKKLQTKIWLYQRPNENEAPTCRSILNKLSQEGQPLFKALLTVYVSSDEKYGFANDRKYLALLDFIKQKIKTKGCSPAEYQAARELLQAIKEHAQKNNKQKIIKQVNAIVNKNLSRLEKAKQKVIDILENLKKNVGVHVVNNITENKDYRELKKLIKKCAPEEQETLMKFIADQKVARPRLVQQINIFEALLKKEANMKPASSVVLVTAPSISSLLRAPSAVSVLPLVVPPSVSVVPSDAQSLPVKAAPPPPLPFFSNRLHDSPVKLLEIKLPINLLIISRNFKEVHKGPVKFSPQTSAQKDQVSYYMSPGMKMSQHATDEHGEAYNELADHILNVIRQLIEQIKEITEKTEVEPFKIFIDKDLKPERALAIQTAIQTARTSNPNIHIELIDQKGNVIDKPSDSAKLRT